MIRSLFRAWLIGLALGLGVGYTGVMLATVPGCALIESDGEPLKAYDQANEIYIALLETAINARMTRDSDGQPLISDEDWREDYLPVIRRGDRLLDEFEAAARVGNAREIDRILALLEAVNAELRTLIH